MHNILDYLKWRGDTPFNVSVFNEVDDLILARFSYIPFEKFLKDEEKLTIEESFNISKEENIEKKEYIQEEDYEMFELLSKSERFKKLKIKNFVNIFDEKLEKQFAAITIYLPKNEIYISYRGTDNTVIGWKEDFNMTFLSNIPSQLEALKYLNNTKTFFGKKIRVGGHSKGGNLAVYSSVNCDKKIKNKILSVSSYDGPGFLDETIDSDKYQEIKDIIHTYVPQTSIIGRFLNYNDGYKTVESMQKGILQHDVFTWNINPKSFEYLEDIDKDSKKIDAIITEWLNKLSLEDRNKIINILFKMLSSANISTFDEFDNKVHKVFLKILSSYRKISKEDKKMLDKMTNRLIKSIKEILFKRNKKEEKKN